MATPDSGTMQSFQKHIEDMRSLTLCKICLKPFFEPYIISCGHTYCYSCLRSWFGNNTDRAKTKSCPDCRVVVRVQPAPNYILRDLTHMFIGRAELLPEDESVQEHDKDKQEAAAQLTKDREGAGLFQGVFNQILPTHLRGPIRDLEDGVDRCPMCNWELDHGVCAGCGLDMNESDYESEDTEISIREIDIDRPPQGMFYGVGSDSDDDSSEDESNLSGPNEYDHHDDFLDNENEDDVDDLDDMEGMVDQEDFYPQRHRASVRRRHRRVAFSDEESSEGEDEDEPRSGRTHPQSRSAYSAVHLVEDSATNYDDSENDMEPDRADHETIQIDSDDEQPVIRAQANAGAVSATRRRPLVVDDDEDEEEDVQSEHAFFSSQAGTETSANEEESDDDGTLSDQTSDSDSEDSSGSESESEMQIGHVPQEASDSEDTDDTAQPEPPQPRDVRQQRLQNQRARRPQQHHSRILPPMSNYPHNGPDERMSQRGQTSKATRVY